MYEVHITNSPWNQDIDRGVRYEVSISSLPSTFSPRNAEYREQPCHKRASLEIKAQRVEKARFMQCVDLPPSTLFKSCDLIILEFYGCGAEKTPLCLHSPRRSRKIRGIIIVVKEEDATKREPRRLVLWRCHIKIYTTQSQIEPHGIEFFAPISP